ncbi:VaFE repeat-containing surface-anchored protein [Acutalibacter muris]|uniref:VaFE repeat-containing surface-anchored protein n=1 Tax=Acutalibacter muris TaxID=1796620 RepID=UPI001C3EF798|nr:VaFE repeat-containing surface-anchored protein [Acutalibacter muris]
MQKTMKRTLALILAVVLCFSAMPFSAFAVEMTPDETLSSHAPSSEAPAESSQPEPSAAPETGPESSAAPEESAVTSTGSSPAPSTEPTAEPAADPTPEPATGSDDSGLTPGTELDMNRVWPALRRAQARAAGKFGTDGTLYVGDYCFPGGVGTPPTLGEYIGPMPIETMRYGSNNVAAFCIEHEKESGSGMGYTWMDLSTNNQETLGTILALGFQWNAASPWAVPSDNSDKWVVTQVLIWETIAGHAFLQGNGLIGIESGVDADMQMISAHAYNPTKFMEYYRDLKKRLNDYFKVPSFANKEASKADTITLRWDGSKYSATVTDSNGVLNNYKFENCLKNVKVTANGNSLTLSTTSPILSPVTSSQVQSDNNLAGGKGAVAVWRTADRNFQDFATYYKEGGDPVSCYIKVKTDAVGSAGLVKTSEDGKVEGIQFQITGSDGSSTTKTTDASGNIDIEGLPIYSADGSKITYTATEINVPNKYVKPESQTFQLTEGQTASIHFENKLKRWRVTVTKSDEQTGSTPQGNGSLAGAKYGVYRGNELVKEYTTDENGQFTTDYYPYGEDWTLREISASPGYLVSEESTKLCEIPAGSNEENNDNTASVTETIICGGVSVEKRDSKTGERPQGDADFSGIQFEIVNKSKNPVEVGGKKAAPDEVAMTITTNAQGVATTGPNVLPYGDYLIRESKTNASMLKTFTEEIPVTVSENGKVYTFTAENDVVRGGIAVEKRDSQTGERPQGNADFSGITFEIVNSSRNPVEVDGTTYATGQVVATLITDESGYANTEDEVLPYGTYTLREVSTNDSMLHTFKEQTVPVTEHKKTYVVTAENDVVRGGLSVEKRDSITGSTPQGNADFSGITFEIINDSRNPVIVGDKSIDHGEVALTLTTDSEGKASTAADALPYGSYVLHESATNESMLNTAPDQPVEVTENGKVYPFFMDNEVVRGGVLIEKRDLESLLLTPLGGASLDGTLFEITNKSRNPVYVNGALYQPDEVCLTIEVKDGVAQSDVRALPYGSYELAESKPGTGYLWTDKTIRPFDVLIDGSVKEYREGDAAYNQVIRGDLKFVKVGEKNMHRFANVAFKLTSQTTGESHILVTDANGEVRTETKWNAHSLNTNGNDDKPEAEWDDETGTWFGKTTEDWMVETQDGLCALPYDYYTLQELRCEGNKGYALVTVPNIFISRDSTVIELGTIDDHEEGMPEIGTTATVDGEKTGEPVSEVTIVDTVRYSGLTVGKTYKLSGTLMDKATGEPLTVDGKQVTAEKEFTSKAESGTEELRYTFNASALAGKSVVVFEDLFEGENKIASHTDIEDEGQTVTFTEPKIGTTATANGEHTAEPVGEITIVDTVKYSGLIPGKEYTVKGVLMDKATGKPLMVEGKKITAEATFRASKAEGAIDIPFTFDASALAGKTVVVFETLYRDKLEVCAHADSEDEDQTVTFSEKPEIKTTATVDGEKKAEPKGEITITDTVSYTGLTPGKTYKLSGVLMDKASGAPLLVDGQQVTAEKEFIPESASGTVEMAFTFDASALAGKSVVVFETLFHEGKEVTAHADINDLGQTVEFTTPDKPEIKTEATVNGEKEVDPLEEVTIIDKVSYSGLIPGKQYRISGVLMDKGTGEKLLVEGNEVTSEVEFTPETPDGAEEIPFIFNASTLAGKTIVVFETLYQENVEVFVHADINDKSQTITIRGRGGLLIKKTAEDDFVEGISFLVTGKDYSKKFKTDKNGEIRVDNLVPGEYTVTEISDKVTARYEVQEGKTVTVTADGKTAEVKFHNKLLRGQIVGRKTDTEGNPLEGVLFGLFPKDAKEFTKDKAVATAKTDKNGRFEFSDVPYGDWQIVELEALPGYVPLDKSIKVAVDSSTVTLEDIQNAKTKIVISKVDSVTGKELAGAKLELKGKDGKVIESWITDGKPHTIDSLPAGEYVLHEASAPDGYLLAEDVKFTVKETDEGITVVMKDRPKDVPSTPNTGDRGWLLALTVFGVSLAGVVISLVLSRKKKKEQD